jgi:serine protease
MRGALLLLTTLSLVACGGGGSSGGGNRESPPSEPPPAPPPPVVDTFTLSGTVSASRSQAVDGDTNDPATPFSPNDTIASAQRINNPTTLGGHVNQPGAGEPGRTQTVGDVDDFFQVDLLAGQGVTMLVADFESADADLYLYDLAGNVVDFSVETGELETLVAPADGTFIVNATAFSGATNYILAIGNQDSATAAYSRQHYIEPWQAVVRYMPDVPAQASVDARLALERRGGGSGREHLLALRRGGADVSLPGRRLGSAASRRYQFRDPELQARFETLLTIKQLQRHPEVAMAEPNYRMRTFLQPDDEAYGVQWHYPLIDLPAAWDTTVGDEGVVVAVVDTGILAGHPDLRGQLVPGYDFVRDPASGADGNGIDPDPEDPGNLRAPGPSSFHGTHVAGTVAAAGNNGIGVTGVAYGARIMPLRALGDGGAGTSYDVRQAVRYAAGLTNDSGSVPEQPADIINLSLGGGPFSTVDQQLYDEVRARGVIVVAAAGNEATRAPQYPASYRGVLSVSAVDINRQLTGYSNSGDSIDLAAPGGTNGTDFNGDGYPDGVLSTGGTGNRDPDFAYTFLNGTSMAAPHAAGVFALMRSVNPDLSPGDIDNLLEAGALTDDLGAAGRDDSYGHGLVNAYKAVLAALQSLGGDTVDAPRLAVSATSLSFGSSDQPLQLDLNNAGSGDLSVIDITTSEAWLSITPVDVDEAGLGRYAVGVDRSGLDQGVYAGGITVTTSANASTVRVFMSVGSPGSEADVGAVYVLLYDPINEETVDDVSTSLEDGRYRFRFEDVPAGEYELVAGSDADNDLFICDAGEACGAWLTLDQPIRLTPDADRSDLDFPVEYQVFLPEVSATVSAGSGRGRPHGYPLSQRHCDPQRTDARCDDRAR